MLQISFSVASLPALDIFFFYNSRFNRWHEKRDSVWNINMLWCSKKCNGTDSWKKRLKIKGTKKRKGEKECRKKKRGWFLIVWTDSLLGKNTLHYGYLARTSIHDQNGRKRSYKRWEISFVMISRYQDLVYQEKTKSYLGDNKK